MTPIQQQLAAELEPLMMEVERALKAGDTARCRTLAIAMIDVVAKYSGLLDRRAIREVMNSPTANAIAERLGVRPKLH